MGYLIDACLFIAWERERLDLAARIKANPDAGMFVSVVTCSELLHGVWRATGASARTRRTAFVEHIVQQFPLLPVDEAAARIHARVWAELEEAGTMIGPNDLWLAASALAHGLTFATANIGEFRRVPGLDVEDWSAPAGAGRHGG